MNRKMFAQRFDRELTLLGFPEDLTEKTKAIAKVFGVNRYLANAMLYGMVAPTESQLIDIAKILDVCPKWLSGITDRKKSFPCEDALESA